MGKAVIIKGMKIPRKCTECPMSRFNSFLKVTECRAIGNNIIAEAFFQEKRDPRCPLEEIEI